MYRIIEILIRRPKFRSRLARVRKRLPPKDPPHFALPISGKFLLALRDEGKLKITYGEPSAAD